MGIWDEKPVEQLNKKGPDIKPFEINSGKHILKKMVDETNLGEKPPEADYAMYLKSLLSDSDTNKSLDKCGDEKDDLDPQYSEFIANLKPDGLSCSLEIAKNGGSMVFVLYEKTNKSADMCTDTRKNMIRDDDDDDSDEKDDFDPQYSEFLANVKADGLSYRLEIAKNDGSMESVLYERVGESADMCTRMHSPVEFMTDITIRDTEFEKNKVTNELRTCKNMIEDVKSEGLKAKKRVLKRKRVENVKRPGSILKPKTNDVLGREWQQELNGDDVDECYKNFLDSGKIQGDCVVYAAADKKTPVVNKELAVVCYDDPEVLMTCNASGFDDEPLLLTAGNEQLSLVKYGEEVDSGFKKKLMAKLDEPYNEREYIMLWKHINEEKPKVKHYDLRGSRATKSFLSDELGPSYLATYPLLKRKIDAAGNDRLKKLNYLRGFFFWLQNAPHEDAFEPWVEKRW